jgi:hypothetical protein
VYTAVRLGLPWLTNSVWDSIVKNAEVERKLADPINGDTANLVALLLAFAATTTVIREFWGRRQSTEAWGKGAQGEERTGRLLDSLPDSYVVRHDLAMPRSRANIDHVVIGPTGVFTIETKNFAGGVAISGGRIRSGSRDRTVIVDQASHQAAVIAERIGRSVRPVVVVHGGVRLGWFASPTVDGVTFCSPRRLSKVLSQGEKTLTAEEVVLLAELVRGRPSVPVVGVVEESCHCGGVWIERRRRADGARFLGCSRFPACRSTQAMS